MNFASAFISMTRGHKVARSHWSGYWHIVDGIIMIHTLVFYYLRESKSLYIKAFFFCQNTMKSYA